MDLKLLKMRCKDSKQHHVMFHELYSVSLLFCIAQNVRFEIPYKVLYFETPFLIIFKYYAWVSCGSVTDEKYKPQFLAQKAANQPRKPSNNDQYNNEIRQIFFISTSFRFVTI